ncbi:MAG: Do family serine endopeptidase [Alphaproteobacteria bacterium]|nr:Do family serine endopeptidase [Alphaproteobacteria bacterium]
MFRHMHAAALVALTVLVVPAVQSAGFPIDQDRGGIPTLAPLLQSVTPGVVNIATATAMRVPGPLLRDPFFRQFFEFGPGRPLQRFSQSSGSGVIVDARRGYVLTNHHVIQDADQVTITLTDGRQLDARVIGTDSETDIALLQVQAENLTAVPMGDSTGVRVGDFVVAIGNPFGLGQTVTSGIVSALGRGGINVEGYEDFIQTDAAINPGNSGGPLIDLNGKLIGINTAIIGPAGGNVGIGFAVPIAMARAVMDQLIEHGEVRRGRLGIDIADLTPRLRGELGVDRATGVVVVGIEPGSAADKGGLRRGDVITGINGQPTSQARDLRNRVGMLRPGDEVELAIVRGSRAQTIEVTLADQRPRAAVPLRAPGRVL